MPPASLGSPQLLLVPTEREAARLADLGGFGRGLAIQALCGFGPVAAAARSAQLLGRLRPARVLLVGIAGSFDPRAHPVAEATVFTRCALEGVGAGEGEGFRDPPALGFAQWPGGDDEAPVGCELPLAAPPGVPEALLLTTCAASGSPEHAARRRERWPAARAEDMEAFGVALACALFGVPLCVVRGLSNEVGDRDSARWRIPAALAAARRRALDVLARDWSAA